MEKNEYFPMAIGDTWNYADSQTGTTLTISVDSLVTKSGVEYYHLKNFAPFFFRSSISKIYAFDKDAGADVLYLDFAADSFETHLAGSNIKVSLMATYDSLTIKNRVFKTVRRYSFHNRQVIDADLELYLCKDVGIVRYVILGAGTYYFESTDYTLTR